MRIDKFLSNSLPLSRSDVKKYLKYGNVRVDDKIIKQASYNVLEHEKVYLHNKEVIYRKYIYLVLNKPAGVVSATKDNLSKTVIDILNDDYKKMGLFPVGRLDKDTEGLLFLTNDGDFSHRACSPKKHVNKKYLVHVNGAIDEKDVIAFKEGITIDKDVLLKSAKLEIVSSSENFSVCYVTISEGKFHQVKKMFLAIGTEVVFLKRVSFAEFYLPDDLETGNYRPLTDIELSSIMEVIYE